MSSSRISDLSTINNDSIPDETNDAIISNTLLYPIGKAFLETYPQYYDIIRTYENAVESISDIIQNDVTIDEFINVNDSVTVNFKLWMENTRIYPPDSIEAAKYSNFGYVPTPNHALATKGLYSAVVISDIVFTYEYFHKESKYSSCTDLIKHIDNMKIGSNITRCEIPNGYIVNVPIPIGCKWCSTRHYDQQTLIKSGEEIKSLYGYFIVDGFFRYILSLYKKPFNKPIILKNNFDDQLSRTEMLHTKGYEYEESYYTVGAMLTLKNQHVGRGGAVAAPPDFGISLQVNHPSINVDAAFGGKYTHKLYNFVPIKFLFAAFGCTTDDELIHYVCPEMNDFGLINAVRQACLNGHKHREAIRIASIKTKSTSYLAYEEPMTEFLAKYIIGCIILKQTVKDELLNKCNKDEDDYKILVVQLVTSILDERFMPGVGDNSKVDRNTAVCVELGTVVKRLYLIGYGLEASQDKTSLTNRRVRIGQQLSREFKAFHRARKREIIQEVNQLFVNNHDMLHIKDVILNKMTIVAKNISVDQSRSLINAFKGTSKEQSKLRTDLLAVKNQAFVWNKLREIVISSDTAATGTTVTWEHRTVHQSELYFICPTQTPESGKETGRYRTPTLYTYTTIATKGLGLLEIVQNHPDYIISTKAAKNIGTLYSIRLNGSIVGYVPEFEPIESLYQQLLEARSTGKVEHDATITINHTIGYLEIWTDTGRLVSPFVIVKNCFNIKRKPSAKKFMFDTEISIVEGFRTWLSECAVDIDHFHDGITKRYIEFMDSDMCINNAVIAPSIKEFYQKPSMYTHIALPSHIHGIIASIPPAMNLNAGVRCAYLTNHVKQAIGPVLKYPQLKYIGENNILISPQVPIVRPCTYNFLHMNETPIGNNVVVAFMQFKYNQEDSIILNRASVEQGMLRIDSLITKEYKIDKNDEEFKVPETGTVLNGNPDSYSKLDQVTALPKRISDVFWERDALIAKVTKSTEGENDTSIMNDKPDGKYPPSANPRPLRCIVKSKIQGENKVMKKQMFGQFRSPLVGDKFNSEHAQKGTCGKIMDPEDMPYTKTGLRPDVIFNPPAIFKRKTYGQIYVAIIAKIATLLGCPIDCTPYHTIRNDDDLVKILKQLGLDDAGYETLYDGETNRPYKSRIFVGMHYWERQSHLVEQKLNVRNGGPKVIETGQPMKGRKHHGGQSADRMTFDTHIAAGINECIRDIHLNQGSKIKIGICNRCHTTMGYYNQERKEWICPRCGSHQDFIIRDVPPASALMVHIFNGLHISVDYFEHANMLSNERSIEYGGNDNDVEDVQVEEVANAGDGTVADDLASSETTVNEETKMEGSW